MRNGVLRITPDNYISLYDGSRRVLWVIAADIYSVSHVDSGSDKSQSSKIDILPAAGYLLPQSTRGIGDSNFIRVIG